MLPLTVGINDSLARILIENLKALSGTGLVVKGVVCDQGSNNMAAINYLKNENRRNCLRNEIPYDDRFIEVHGTKLLHFFDVPYLMKGIRNNLLKGYIHCKLNGKNMVGSWKHIEQLYAIDSTRVIRSVPKLTEYHVVPAHIKKMKVKYCTQIFSQRVSSIIYRGTWY